MRSSKLPLVSILIPAYNGEHVVAAAVESALAQTHPSVEIIVVDDGSTDRTCEVLRPFELRGVRVISQSNAGASAARNRALAESGGTFVQYLDADDMLAPDKVECQISLLKESPPGCIAVCGTVYFKDGCEPESGRFVGGYSALNSDDPVQWLVDLWTPGPGYGTTRWGMVQPAAYLTPRTVVDAAGRWDEHRSPDDDGEYFTRVLVASRGVRWEPHSRTYYRQFDEPGSLSSQRSREHMLGRLRSVDSKVRHVLPRATSRNWDQARAALARQFMDVAFHAYPAHPDVACQAEQKAGELGGYQTTFFGHSPIGEHVERVLGWKAARYLSNAVTELGSAVRKPGLKSR